MGLILNKQSGKAYRTLSKIFCFPSKKTLSNLLQRIPTNSGYNEYNVRQLSDEVSTEPHVDFRKNTFGFDGFVNVGKARTGHTIADHARVFMVRGLIRK
jgi:hypothetical protein